MEFVTEPRFTALLFSVGEAVVIFSPLKESAGFCDPAGRRFTSPNSLIVVTSVVVLVSLLEFVQATRSRSHNTKKKEKVDG